MANLRDIKSRIKSIQNTQKITQAMRMVAAAKVKKAENKVKQARPYTEEIVRSFKKVLATNPNVLDPDLKHEKAIENFPALLHEREVKTVGLLVVTSDKGLAGAYNANVVRKTMARVKELKAEGKAVKLFIVGSKGIITLKREFSNSDIDIVETYSKLPAIPTSGAANVIAEDIAESYVDCKIDKVEVVTTKFKSMLSYSVEVWQVLPAKVPEHPAEGLEPEMLFEPSPEQVLQKLVPLYFSNSIYQAMLEAAASELAARMTAMSNATTNASDMINYLTIIYNKARQASITQEIVEVVSGSNALER